MSMVYVLHIVNEYVALIQYFLYRVFNVKGFGFFQLINFFLSLGNNLSKIDCNFPSRSKQY